MFLTLNEYTGQLLVGPKCIVDACWILVGWAMLYFNAMLNNNRPNFGPDYFYNCASCFLQVQALPFLKSSCMNFREILIKF